MEEIDIEADKGARKYYEQSERDRPDKETVGRTLQWMEDDEQANLQSGIDTLASAGRPVSIRENNQRQISQVSPYVTDPAIAGVTKDASAPSVTSDDGTTRTQYGAYTRVTDRDGNVSWEQDGKKVDAPESMKFMSRFAREKDRKEMGVADDGGDGVASLDSVRGYELYNRMSQQNRAKKRAEFNKNIARTLAGALDAAARSDKVTVDDGVSYKEGVVEKKLLEETNRMLSSVGQHTIKGIMVRQRVNPNDPSQPLGDPMFTIEYNKDGARRSGGDVVSRTFNRGQVEDRIRKAFSVSGKAADGEDLIKKLFRDRAGEIKAEKDAAAKKEAEKVKLEEDKRRWEMEQQRKNEETRANTIKILGEQGVTSAGGSKGFPSREAFLNKIVSDDKLMDMYRDSGEVAKDSDGNAKLDDQGNEVHVMLSDKEVIDRAGELYDAIAKDRREQGTMSLEDRLNYIRTGKIGVPSQAQVLEPTQVVAPQAETQQGNAPTLEQLMAERAKRNAAQQAQNNGQQPVATPAPTEAAVATPGAAVVAEPTQVQPETAQVTVNPELASAVPTNPVEGIVDWYENRRGQNPAEIARQRAEDERRRMQNSPEVQRAMEISRQQKVAHEYLRGKTLQDVTREVASDVASSRGIVLRGNPETWPADVRAQIEREVGSIYNDANEDAFFDKNKGNMYSDFNPRTGQMLYNRGASPVISERRKHIDENQELRRQHIEYIKARDAGNVSPSGDYPMLRDDQNDVEDPEYMRGIKEQSDNFLKSLKGKTPAAQKKAVAEEMKRIDGFDLGDSLKRLLKGSLAYEFMQFISGNESEY